MRWRMRVIEPGTVRVPTLNNRVRPGGILVSDSQTMCAANWSAAWTGSRASPSASPRETSISLSSTSVTASPARATARSPSNVTIRVTVALWPDPLVVTASPGRTAPVATVPANPLKSALGLDTHCTGIRNGPSATPTGRIASSASSSAGPAYQGVFALRPMTLSPSRALIGIASTVKNPAVATAAR